MNLYGNESVELESYSVEDGKIIEKYVSHSKYGSKRETQSIPYSTHNIEACNRQLNRQFQMIKQIQYPNYRKSLKRALVFGGAELSIGVISYLAGTDSKFLYWLIGFYLLNFAFDFLLLHKKIRNIEITDYCLENASQIPIVLSDESYNSISLSDGGKKAYQMDQGFSLNHSHLYTNQDLKKLEKSLKKIC